MPSEDSVLPTIKISDFGFAKFLPNSSLTTSYCGTPLYMAPEVISRKSYDAKADLWSVGVLLYEMMMGKKICQTNQMFELEEFLRNYKNQVDFTGSQHVFSRELKDLISVLLKKNPIERASCEDFFHHVELLTKRIQDDDDEEYVVVIDMKRNNSNHSLNRYSSSAPTHTVSLLQEDYITRERKFSVGSAGSVLTKAISKAFFGGNHNSSSSSGTHSPPSPLTPPIIEEESLIVEEITLDKLLISQQMYKSDDVFINHMIEMIDAVESLAESKYPIDFTTAEEAMAIYTKVTLLLEITLDYINNQHSPLSLSLRKRYNVNKNKALQLGEHCGKEESDLSIESILYNHAVESVSVHIISHLFFTHYY